jgi:hypothetical protein
MAGVYVHPEIDDFLLRADEVLAECLKPMTSGASTGTSTGTRKKGRPGAKKRGSKKSIRPTGPAMESLSGWEGSWQ